MNTDKIIKLISAKDLYEYCFRYDTPFVIIKNQLYLITAINDNFEILPEYENTEYLIKISLENGEKEKLTTVNVNYEIKDTIVNPYMPKYQKMKTMCYVNNDIYYSANCGLFKYDIKTNKAEKISDQSLFYINNIVENKIFYQVPIKSYQVEDEFNNVDLYSFDLNTVICKKYN